VLVGGEHLERRHSSIDGGRYPIEHRRVLPCYRAVQAVVDVSVPGLLLLFLDPFEKCAFFLPDAQITRPGLPAEVDTGSDAAERGSTRRGLVGVDREHIVDVNVGIDDTGHHELAGCIYRLVGGRESAIVPDSDDLPVVDRDTAVEHAIFRY
jgi:hypothetical protein